MTSKWTWYIVGLLVLEFFCFGMFIGEFFPEPILALWFFPMFGSMLVLPYTIIFFFFYYLVKVIK